MTYTLHQGDCLDVLPTLAANSVDTVITDPPYGLSFMGKDWDHGVPGVPFWCEVLRVAKPGALLLAFGGTRTYHRLTCAIEDAGWEVRDCLMWLYAQGFPKSHDISKAIDKAAGEAREVVGMVRKTPSASSANMNDGWRRPWADGHPNTMAITAPATDAARTWHGWGTALKPAWEPIILAMKPLDGTFAQNAQRWGVAGLNVDGGRIGTDSTIRSQNDGPKWSGKYNGGARLNGSSAGRWPANVILDEEAAVALDAQSGERGNNWRQSKSNKSVDVNGYDGGWKPVLNRNDYASDTGGASRFFYVAKASRAERNAGLEGNSNGVQGNRPNSPDPSGKFPDHDHRERGANHHPTVKPLALMRYLCRLTATPTGGVVLDPFCGSGTTGVACMLEGRNFIGIELDAGYFGIARRRIENVQPALGIVAAGQDQAIQGAGN